MKCDIMVITFLTVGREESKKKVLCHVLYLISLPKLMVHGLGASVSES